MKAVQDFSYLNFLRNSYGFYFEDNYKLHINIFIYTFIIIFLFINIMQDLLYLYKMDSNNLTDKANKIESSQ